MRAETTVEASTSKPRTLPPPPKLGPVIREINKVASTTRERLVQIKDAIAEHREAATERARERFGAVVQKTVTNIIDRLTGAAEELTTIAARIKAHIETKQAAGLAMAGSSAALATAEADISTAESKIGDASAALSAALASTSPKGEMVRVRSAVKAAEEALKVAKQSLKETLQAVRADTTASSSTKVE